MKNSFKTIAAIMLFSTVLGATTSFAKDEKDQAKSEATVNFVAGGEEGEVVPPTHPEKPGNPITPSFPGGGHGEGGPLSIDFAPNFNFGEQKVSAKDEHYSAKLQEAKDENDKDIVVPNYVQVSDVRGSMEGWELTLTQKDNFISDKDHELTGAKITLSNGAVESDMPENTLATNEVTGAVELTPNVPAKLMVAGEEHGMGTQTLRFGTLGEDSTEETQEEQAKSVDLFVPHTALQYADESYKTTLEWNLVSAPGNSETPGNPEETPEA
ncbi:WxL domain-containing protein [Vagococcus sp. PNs007]|uniref:WxL domain-containing protein n=1 Tax=Vagococcus proximus TaxID=2991417 RepID=A0ABT5WZ23_9ENTE|nr:WxL domain-containing protein [Vagococcus proximus]MDF0479012.1 WxL domain-containing protein [Vagococcus proximus]